MEALWVLLALVPIALLVMLIVSIGQLSGLRKEVHTLRLQMQELMKALAQRPQAPSPAPESVPKAAAPEPPPTVVVEAPAPRAIPVPPPLPAPSPPIQPTIVVEPPRPQAPPLPSPPPKPGFLERNPDLEKFIGENLMNKIGIAVLVAGLGLFLKYAIGKGFISETGQTLIGIGSGALLIFFGHRLRMGFRPFSSVLVGGGLAVLYFSIYIAFQDFGIIAQTPAFLIMVGITAIGVLLTLVFDRKELAVIALLGGFASPFLASRGDGNYVVLFTYLLILNVGMLVLANYKKWHLINVISFVLTALILGLWLGADFWYMQPRPVWPAMVFATGFFLVFFFMNVHYNLRHGSRFVTLDFSLLLANAAVYFAAGLSILNGLKPSLDGLFTIALAAFHLVFAVLYVRRRDTPKHLVYLLIGLVLTFLSLAAPIQLEGNNITLFWAAECVLLLWFSQRTGLRLVERASVLVLLLMAISLGMDLVKYYGAVPLTRLTPLLNRPWITSIVSAAACYLYARLCEKLPAEREVLPGLSPRALRNAAYVLCAAIFFLANLLELAHQLGYHYEPEVVRMALTAYALLAFAVMYLLTRGKAKGFGAAVLVCSILALLYHLTSFHSASMAALLQVRLGTGGSGSTLFHLLALGGAVAVIICVTQAVRKLITRPSAGWDIYLWAICTFVVVFATQELDHLLLAVVKPMTYAAADPAYALVVQPEDALMDAMISVRRAAYPILWGVGSFTFMWYGMRTRQRMVRIIALSLFGIALLKLFLVDVWEMSEAGRVAAFICLGVLLLVVSFMYNKLKVLVKEDGRSDDQMMG